MENTTLVDVFLKFNNRNKTAFTFRTGIRRLEYSYQDLHILSLKMSAWLEAKGVGKGDRIMIWAPNSPWWAVAFWGAILRGAIVVPVDFSSNQDRASKIAELTESKIILQSQLKIDGIKNGIPIEKLEYELQDLPPASVSAINQPTPDDIVELIYTSGTTGNPKGVILTHKNICANLDQISDLTKADENYNFLSLLPLSHMFEQTAGFFTPLARGSRIVYVLTLKPSTIIEAFKEEDIYVAVIVPRLLQSLRSTIERELENKHLISAFKSLSKLSENWQPENKRKLFWLITKNFGKNIKFFVSGGSALDLETFLFWKKIGFPVVEGYGLTECAPVLTANTPTIQIAGSVGKPVKDVEIKIIDGEIFARGNNIFPGYWQNPEATEAAFKDGWFKTGDLGELDRDGNLFIKGRRKDMILSSSGLNVYPEDIESVLNNLPAVKESCVVGLTSTNGEDIHAVLILNGQHNPQDIIKQANSKLEDHQRIQSCSVWPDAEFPKTSTLKIQKFKVKQAISRDSSQNIPKSYDEIQYIISQVTGCQMSEITDQASLIDDLGLTSLASLELVMAIEQKFKLDIDDSFITQATTVGDLRKFIQKREKISQKNIFWFWTNSWWARLLRIIRDIICYPFYSLIAPRKVFGRENLSEINGPVIYISNHTSFLDQPMIMYSLPSQQRYTTATAAWQELFFNDQGGFFKSTFMKLVFAYTSIFRNVFPLPQSSSFRKTLAHMGKLIDHNISFLIFPEGSMTRDGKMLPFMNGLGLMVKALQVPIVPIYISGAGKVLPPYAKIPKRNRVTVTFGKPLVFNNEEPDVIIKKCANAVISLSKSKSLI